MRKLVLTFVLTAAVCIVGAPAALHAGTLPDISGTWYANGDSSKRCQISQSGNSITLTNEDGARATGSFADPSTLTTRWPYPPYTIRGTISSDLRTIRWNNNTYWSRRWVPTPAPNPYRLLPFAANNLSQAHGPIKVLDGWGAVKLDGKGAVACVSFKNESAVVATRVLFAFPLTNKRGRVLETLELDRRGTFSPNIDIRGWDTLDSYRGGVGHRGYGDNCAVRQSNVAAMSLLNAHFFTYRIERVEFSDGTVWPAP